MKKLFSNYIQGQLTPMFWNFPRVLFQSIRHDLTGFVRWVNFRLPVQERVLIFLIFFLFILSTRPWQEYQIVMEGKTILHGNSTDDFLKILIFLAFTGLPWLIMIFERPPNPTSTKICIFLRIIGLLGVNVLWVANYSDPTRISMAEVGYFRIEFYLFFLVLLASDILGVLGIISYAQNP